MKTNIGDIVKESQNNVLYIVLSETIDNCYSHPEQYQLDSYGDFALVTSMNDILVSATND